MKKFLSLLLALLMVFSLLPVSALADDEIIEEEPIAAEEILTEEPEEEPAEEPEEGSAEEPVPAEEPEAAAEEIPAEPAEEATEALPAEEEAAEEPEALGETELLAAPGPSTNIIDAKYIPDKNFRSRLIELCGSTLTLADAAEITSLDLGNKEISNLTGIQYFTGLRTLFVYGNTLTKLDVSNCTNLQYLHCKSNKLTELNLSGCSKLETLYCENNCLTELDLSSCTSLIFLYCDNNALTELNLSVWGSLNTLYCENNCLTELDLSGRSSLECLYCGNNALTGLYLSGCSYLETLYCDNNALTKLDLSTCTDLARFDCDKNELAELDLSCCPNLEYLYCDNNALTELNLRGCNYLEYLECDNNRLLELDLSSNKNLSAFFSSLGIQYPREPVGAAVLNRVYVLDDIGSFAVLDEPSGGQLKPDSAEENWGQLSPGSNIFIAEGTPDVLNYAIEVELFSGETATMLISRPVECAAADFAVGTDYILMELGQEPEKITCNYSEPVKTLIDMGLMNITYTACDANDPDACTVIALDSGKVVPLTAGTAYVDVALEMTRVPLRIHRVCVDVVEDINTAEVVSATLPVNTATVELFKTDYTEIDVLLDLQRWYDDELKDSALLGIVDQDPDAMPVNKGTAIDYAEFAEEILNGMFILVPVSDRRLAIVPTPDYIRDVYSGVCTAPKKVSAPILITLNSGDTLETEALTVTLKTTKPTLKAGALKFNSLLNEEKNIVFTGGKVKEIAAAARPIWLQLDKNASGCTLKYTGKSGMKLSGKMTLDCTVDGWAVTAPVTVSVSASAVKPKISLDKKSITLTAGTSGVICCTATISPGAFAKDWHLVSVIDTKTKQTLTANGSTVPSVYTYNYAPSNGTAVAEAYFHASICSPDGKTHSYKYTFAAGSATASVTVKVLPETTPIKLTAKTTGTIDFSVPGSTVTFTPTLTNMQKMPDVGYNAYLRITAVKGEKKGADPISAWDYFEISPDDYNEFVGGYDVVPLQVTAGTDSIPTGYTYYAYVDAVNFNGDVLSSVKVKIPVKTSNPAKVQPAVTAKVSSKLDQLRTNTVILTVTAKNFYGWDNEDVTLGFYRTYDGANGKAEMQHLGNFEEPENPFGYYSLEGGVQIFISKPFVIHPKDKFAVRVNITNDYDITAVSGPINLPVTVGKAVLKLTTANATMLQGDPYSEAAFAVTYADTSLCGIGTVQLDAASANLFELTLQKDGAYVLHWKDSTCPPAMKSGTVKTVKLNVWMEGSAAVDEDGNLVDPTVKPNATLQLKVTVR